MKLDDSKLCKQYNCPYFDDECTHPSAPEPEDCDILPTLPPIEEISLYPPMYVRFTYRDEWKHIPEDEVYPVWTEMDIATSAFAFRKRHQSQGALVAITTTDLIDWKVFGEIEE